MSFCHGINDRESVIKRTQKTTRKKKIKTSLGEGGMVDAEEIQVLLVGWR